MVREQVARPQDGEQVWYFDAQATKARLGGRSPRLLFEVRAIQLREHDQAAEIEQAFRLVYVARLKLQLARQKLEDLGGHARIDLEAHHARVAPPASKLRLDRGKQVLGIAVDLVKVTVARDAERVMGDDLHAREQRLHVQGDDVLERHVAAAFHKWDEPGQHRRHLDPREPLLVALRIADHDRKVQRQVRDVWEGMARVDRQGSEHRKDLLAEDCVELAQLFLGHLIGAHDHDARFCKLRNDDFIEERDLPVDQALDTSPDRAELLQWGHAVGRSSRHGRQDLLLQAGDPDLEEVVEVLAEDRQETNPLQKGQLGVLRHGEDTLVEVESGQLPVEVAGRLRDRIRACLIRVRLDPHHHVTNISGCRPEVGYRPVNLVPPPAAGHLRQRAGGPLASDNLRLSRSGRLRTARRGCLATAGRLATPQMPPARSSQAPELGGRLRRSARRLTIGFVAMSRRPREDSSTGRARKLTATLKGPRS